MAKFVFEIAQIQGWTRYPTRGTRLSRKYAFAYRSVLEMQRKEG